MSATIVSARAAVLHRRRRSQREPTHHFFLSLLCPPTSTTSSFLPLPTSNFSSTMPVDRTRERSTSCTLGRYDGSQMRAIEVKKLRCSARSVRCGAAARMTQRRGVLVGRVVELEARALCDHRTRRLVPHKNLERAGDLFSQSVCQRVDGVVNIARREVLRWLDEVRRERDGEERKGLEDGLGGGWSAPSSRETLL